MATSSTSTGPARTMPKPRWCWHCTASPGHPRRTTSSVCSAPCWSAVKASVALNWRGCSGELNACRAATIPGQRRPRRGGRAPARQAPASAAVRGRLFAGRQRAAQVPWAKPLGTARCSAASRCRCRSAWTSAPTASAGLFPGLPGALHEGHAGYVQDKQRLFGEQGQAEGLAALQRLGPLEACAPSGTSTVSPRRCTLRRRQGLLSARVQPLLPAGHPHAEPDHPFQRRPLRVRPQPARSQRTGTPAPSWNCTPAAVSVGFVDGSAPAHLLPGTTHPPDWLEARLRQH